MTYGSEISAYLCVCLLTIVHGRPRHPPRSIPHLVRQRLENYCQGVSLPHLLVFSAVRWLCLQKQPSPPRHCLWCRLWRIWCLEPLLWKKHELCLSFWTSSCLLFIPPYVQRENRISSFGSVAIGTLAMRSLQSGSRIWCLHPWVGICCFYGLEKNHSASQRSHLYKSEQIIPSLPVSQCRSDFLTRKMDAEGPCKL